MILVILVITRVLRLEKGVINWRLFHKAALVILVKTRPRLVISTHISSTTTIACG